ncbi:hypothetical protein BJY52DRAFT_1196330 [Lactarius psammicola]|nr:hypothetical protein BJY52DRAFT_1196330 [Lactarius psammicola]
MHESALFTTTLLPINRTAPAAANLGGSTLSSQTMLLGRQCHQTTLEERYLLFGPLFILSSSAIIKRLFSPRVPRSLTGALSVTGYATAFFFLPMHFVMHRLVSPDPAPVISSLSPSELDYEFVKAALSGWPRRSTMGRDYLVYTGLGPEAAGAQGETPASVAVVPVLTGLAVFAREPLYALASMGARYRAALTQSIVYRP